MRSLVKFLTHIERGYTPARYIDSDHLQNVIDFYTTPYYIMSPFYIFASYFYWSFYHSPPSLFELISNAASRPTSSAKAAPAINKRLSHTMDAPNSQLQPVTLPAFADDATSLAAQQDLGVGDPTDATHTFQPLQSDIENLQHQHQQHLQNANATDTPIFLRPPRPGEPANNLLITSIPHDTPTQQYQQIEDNDTDSGRLDHLNSQLRQQNESNFTLTADMAIKQSDRRKDIKCILDPPDLDSWREKLFNVDETITLSEEQYVS